jgi:hypothetical protein
MGNNFEMRLYDVDEFEGARSARRPVSSRQPAAVYYAEAEIQQGIGRLGVDRNGALVGIELDENVIRRMRPDPLGAYLLAALHAAEALARQKKIDEHRRYR